MARARRMSQREVDAIKKTGVTYVASNLYLQIRDDGTRSWLFQWQRDKKRYSIGLGPERRVPYPDALARADQLRSDLWRGVDIKAQQRAARNQAVEASATKVPTFAEATEKVIETLRPSWSSEKSEAQWRASLRDYANPVIGKKPVRDVTTDDVERILKPIWATKSETAGRVRSRVERILNWAKQMGYREGDNPASHESLEFRLPKLASVQVVKHFGSLDYHEAPALVAELRAKETPGAKALLLVILCGTRTGETLLAEWTDFDDNTRLWTLRDETTKKRKIHKVPLADEALEVLSTIPRTAALLFPGQRDKRKPMSNMAMAKVLRTLRGKGPTVHGCRATFRTWAAEQTDFPDEVLEAAIAHGPKTILHAAYARSTYLDKRRELMRQWARYCWGL